MLNKPYSRETLARKIHHVLANAAQRKLEHNAAPDRNTAVTRAPRKQFRVLVCDNDTLIRESTIEMLRSIGHEATGADNARTALSIMGAAINNLALAVGGVGNFHGKSFARLCSGYSVANGINDKGELVGYSDFDSGAHHAFLYRRGRVIDLGDLANDPKLSSTADAIHARGEIVGSSEVRLTADNSIAQRAFVYSSRKMLNLTFQIETKSPLFGKVRLTDATAINCNGWIAADGFDATTLQAHAYLLIPRGAQRNNCSHRDR